MMFSGDGGVIEMGSGRSPGGPLKTGISGQPGAGVIGAKVASGPTGAGSVGVEGDAGFWGGFVGVAAEGGF